MGTLLGINIRFHTENWMQIPTHQKSNVSKNLVYHSNWQQFLSISPTRWRKNTASSTSITGYNILPFCDHSVVS